MDDLLATPAPAFQTKLAFVTHTLREAILDGRLPPGTRLVIDDLAKRLAVSAIPVREALQVLQSERLVDIKPHSGAAVSSLDPDSIRELFALLEGIETAAIGLAAATVTEDDLATLEDLARQMEKATNDRSWAALNSRFHAMIPRIARMPRAEEFLNRVTVDWERLRRWAFRATPPPDRAQADSDHRAMIAALRARDRAALEDLARTHNRAALGHYLTTT